METVELNLENIQSLDQSWLEILERYNTKEAESSHFIVRMKMPSYKYPFVDFVLQKNNAYVIGILKNGQLINFYKKVYGEYNGNLNKESIKTMMGHFYQLNVGGRIEEKYFDIAVFIISEAARFDFVRAAVRRVYDDDSNPTKTAFINWTNSEQCYTQLNLYWELLHNYSHMRKDVSKHTKNVSVSDAQKFFYKQNNPEIYGDLVSVGLLDANQLYGKEKALF